LFEIDGLREGVIRNDAELFDVAFSGDRDFAVTTFNVSRDQYLAAMTFAREYWVTNDYGLASNNCVHMVFRALEFSGVVPNLHANYFLVTPNMIHYAARQQQQLWPGGL